MLPLTRCNGFQEKPREVVIGVILKETRCQNPALFPAIQIFRQLEDDAEDWRPSVVNFHRRWQYWVKSSRKELNLSFCKKQNYRDTHKEVFTFLFTGQDTLSTGKQCSPISSTCRINSESPLLIKLSRSTRKGASIVTWHHSRGCRRLKNISVLFVCFSGNAEESTTDACQRDVEISKRGSR